MTQADKRKSPTLSGNICDNFALEYHLTLEFENSKGVKNATFAITKATVDIVYGKVDFVVDEPLQVSRKTSVTFVEKKAAGSFSARTNAGPMGYQRSSNLKIAVKKTHSGLSKTKEYMMENKSGFYLSGADNLGECTVSPTTGENENYNDDPQLDFTDSTLFGCHKDFTYKQLEEFCERNDWKDFEIYKNIDKLANMYIGKFGNSDPSYIQDWVKFDPAADS